MCYSSANEQIDAVDNVAAVLISAAWRPNPLMHLHLHLQLHLWPAYFVFVLCVAPSDAMHTLKKKNMGPHIRESTRKFKKYSKYINYIKYI